MTKSVCVCLYQSWLLENSMENFRRNSWAIPIQLVPIRRNANKYPRKRLQKPNKWPEHPNIDYFAYNTFDRHMLTTSNYMFRTQFDSSLVTISNVIRFNGIYIGHITIDLRLNRRGRSISIDARTFTIPWAAYPWQPKPEQERHRNAHHLRLAAHNIREIVPVVVVLRSR